jgi:hypothetical protein
MVSILIFRLGNHRVWGNLHIPCKIAEAVWSTRLFNEDLKTAGGEWYYEYCNLWSFIQTCYDDQKMLRWLGQRAFVEKLYIFFYILEKQSNHIFVWQVHTVWTNLNYIQCKRNYGNWRLQNEKDKSTQLPQVVRRLLIDFYLGSLC